MALRFPRSLMEETYSATALITTSQGGSTNWWARTWGKKQQKMSRRPETTEKLRYYVNVDIFCMGEDHRTEKRGLIPLNVLPSRWCTKSSGKPSSLLALSNVKCLIIILVKQDLIMLSTKLWCWDLGRTINYSLHTILEAWQLLETKQ